MDIAALSSAMAMDSLKNAISMNILSKTMNQDKMSVEFITDSLEKVNAPQENISFGHVLDISV